MKPTLLAIVFVVAALSSCRKDAEPDVAEPVEAPLVTCEDVLVVEHSPPWTMQRIYNVNGVTEDSIDVDQDGTADLRFTIRIETSASGGYHDRDLFVEGLDSTYLTSITVCLQNRDSLTVVSPSDPWSMSWGELGYVWVGFTSCWPFSEGGNVAFKKRVNGHDHMGYFSVRTHLSIPVQYIEMRKVVFALCPDMDLRIAH